MKVRIGIDVGGTFTDAVILDNETYELIGKMKVPTTHSAPEGVAKGIVEVLHKIIEEHKIDPGDVEFIAHGTTQATNALLEGDVVKVGILSYGRGWEGKKTKLDTQIEKIELAPGRFLTSTQQFVEDFKLVPTALNSLQEAGAEVIVAAAPFSVDDPQDEKSIMAEALAAQLPAVGTHEISKLYGLKTRTKTAVINASILPKMMEAAAMTDTSVRISGIEAPLMVMRCDGGVMGINEVKKRPILTMLSGPAAGVAGALMYEKASHGLFLEVGGTSTDISAIVNGRVMVDYAEVGGHKTYVNSLDVRTVGIAGGSLLRISGGKLKDVGPRSAHIAGLPYAVYQRPEKLSDLKLITISPTSEDPADYAAVENGAGEKFAITLACAANFLGYVAGEDYAAGSIESAKLALTALGRELGCTAQEAAEEIMRLAGAKVIPVVQSLLLAYEIEPKQAVLIGGGGGASVIGTYLGKALAMPYRTAKNAEVISPIGVALALVRDVVERTIARPGQDDILKIRGEAEELVIQSGADPATVDVQVEIDAQRNLVRAVATGATSLRTKERGAALPLDKLLKVAAKQMGPVEKVELKASTKLLHVFLGRRVEKKFWGLVSRELCPLIVIDREGVIRLQLADGLVRESSAGTIRRDLKLILEKHAKYGDGGIEMPAPFLLSGGRIIDLSGLISPAQAALLAEAELKSFPPGEKIVVLLKKRN